MKETAFIFNDEINEFKTFENSTNNNNCNSVKKIVRKVEGSHHTSLPPTSSSSSFSSFSPSKRKKLEETCPEENFESESNSDLSPEDSCSTPTTNLSVERFIRKTGGLLNPTYSCRVGGCQFSVKKSLLCIKGHILAEHWPSLVCRNKQA